MTNLFSPQPARRHYPSLNVKFAPAPRTPSLRLVWLRRDDAGQVRTETCSLPLPRP